MTRDGVFEKCSVTVKSKIPKDPWIAKGILKSSKTKHEINHKNYPKLFESIKQRAKSTYYSKIIFHYKDNIKNLANYK